MNNQKKAIPDPYSKTIMNPDQKREPQSFQQLTETYKGPTRRSIAQVKNAIVKQTEDYFTYLDCECSPDFYNRVLGPTADEALLKGLGTIFDVCNKFMYCDQEPEVKLQTQLQTQLQASANLADQNKSVPQVVSDILESVGLPPQMANQIVRNSFAALEQEKPELVNKILQTSTPQMVSKILQTIGLEPEMVSQIIQTMSFDYVGGPKASLVSVAMQTSDQFQQIQQIQQRSSKAKSGGTNEPLSKGPSSKGPSSKEPSRKELSTKELLTKEPRSISDEMIEPSSTTDSPPKMCVCCKCVSPQDEIASKDESLEESPSLDERKTCICCKCYSSKKNGNNGSQSRALSSSNIACIKAKFETPQKLKICRCYECCTPVAYRVKNEQECLCNKPKVKCKCHGDRRKCSNTHITLAKGDTCSLVETSCCCEK